MPWRGPPRSPGSSPTGIGLVTANSRLTIAGLIGMALGGGLAGALSRIGPDWSLRLAFVVYVAATVLAIRLPARVDSTLGERDVDGTPVAEEPLPTPQRGARRMRALPRSVRYVLWLTTGARLLSGFLTLFLGFLMREHPLPGWSGTDGARARHRRGGRRQRARIAHREPPTHPGPGGDRDRHGGRRDRGRAR